MKYILICNCSGKDNKAKMAYDIIFPNTPTPEIIKGKEAIMKLAAEHPNEHIKAIAKIKGNFAYYIDIEDGKIVEEYNLETGRRVG